LFESDELAVSTWPTPNIRFLLIEEDLSEISRGGAVTTMAAPGQYTGIFTRVGKIELETEEDGNITRLINTTTGRATVPPVVSDQLHIPDYKDAPFGGNLFLFGGFSQYLYNQRPSTRSTSQPARWIRNVSRWDRKTAAASRAVSTQASRSVMN
jgi:hypothetical protein